MASRKTTLRRPLAHHMNARIIHLHRSAYSGVPALAVILEPGLSADGGELVTPYTLTRELAEITLNAVLKNHTLTR